jgi:hypothetical protein
LPFEVDAARVALNGAGRPGQLILRWTADPPERIDCFPMPGEAIEVTGLATERSGRSWILEIRTRRLAGHPAGSGDSLGLLVCFADGSGRRVGHYLELDP